MSQLNDGERHVAEMQFNYTVGEIARWIDGEVRGEAEVRITGVGSLAAAGPGQIAYVRDDVAARQAPESKAGALIVHRALANAECPQIVVSDPTHAFVAVLEKYQEATTRRPSGRSPQAVIANSAKLANGVAVGPCTVIEEGAEIGENTLIYPRVYIGHDVSIGPGSIIYPQVVIREGTQIGARCIIHSGSVIGDDGFGYIQRGGRHVKLPQVGRVVIGDDVEIGSLVTIDRAALEETRIGNGVKIDNHSHLAHNVEIGDDAMLIAYAKLAGSVRIGKQVMIAEDVGITDHATVGDGAVVGGGSKVYRDLKPGDVVWGSPARPINLERRIQAILGRLPDLRETVRALETRMQVLEALLRVEEQEGEVE